MTFKKLDPEILEQLKAAVTCKVVAGADVAEEYSHDEMPSAGTGMPDAVVVAASTEDVSAACRVLYENDIPIIPRGAGTGLAGGCAPICGGVVIDTSKMDQILSWDLDNLIVRVQPGVYLHDLAAAAAEKGTMYPPDPGEVYSCLGGNVSTNAGGMRAVKYGTTREYVKAMTVVLPDGRVVKFGAETAKNSSGYSLQHLMVGSEGTLGIITEISLKIIPQPKFTVSLLGVFEDLPSCIRCVSTVKLSGLDPQALEFMPRTNIDMAEAFTGKQVYPHEAEGVEAGAYLLTTFECNSDAQLDELMESAAEVLLEGGALDVVVYDTPEGIRNAFAARRACPEAILEGYEHVEECDIVVPITAIADIVEYAKSIEKEVGLDIHTYGHAGDGNVHMKICANNMDEAEFRRRAQNFLDLVYGRGKGLGAMVSGEHGIGSASIDRLADYSGEDVMELMRGIKAVFDPKGLLNPGKVCKKA